MPGIPELKLLVFGTNKPQWALTSNPDGTTQLRVRDVYCIDLTPRSISTASGSERQQEPLTWKYLWANTTGPDGQPLLLDGNGFSWFDHFKPDRKENLWIALTSEMRKLCQSDPERIFFDKFVGLYVKAAGPTDVWTTPALLPQVWLNVEPRPPKDRAEAVQRQRTPFRVDFVLLHSGPFGDQNFVVEIDGHQHYATPEEAILTIAKSRHVVRSGWTHHRFHRQEVEGLRAEELWDELGIADMSPF